jgi:putative sterol carrier protein
VADVAPVIRAMETTKIVVLGNHGVVAMGESFKEAFGFIELLEEQARINLLLKTSNKFISKIENRESKIEETQTQEKLPGVDKYKMLSKEHRERLTQIVNDDSEVQELGRKYDLTCVLAVKNIQTNEAMRFVYQAGKITKVDDRDDAEFVIIAEPDMLRKVFNRQIDPFVAVTQGKVKTQGDFAKMSKWYPVMVKTFKLWEQAPVE